MSSPFESLPPELMVEILENLDADCLCSTKEECLASLRSYHRLCMTSRTIHQAAMPYLYRNFDNQLKDKSAVGAVHTICAHEGLAKQVRQIRLLASSAIRPPPAENLQPLMAQISGNIQDDAFIVAIEQALSAGCCNAHLLILLNAATAMESMELHSTGQSIIPPTAVCGQCQDLDVLQSLGMFFADEQFRKRYQKLQHEFVYGNLITGTSYKYIIPLLFLPALRTFSAWRLKSTSSTIKWLVPEPSSTLRKVLLDYVRLDTSGTEQIIRAASTLQYLQIRYGDYNIADEDDFDWNFNISPPAILAALRPHLDHLEFLEISNVCNGGRAFEDRPALGSLKGFVGLKTLILDEALLRGNTEWDSIDLANVLPPCIELLTIHTNDDLVILEDICSAFEQYKGDALADVIVSFDLQLNNIDWQCLEPLECLERFPRNRSDVACFVIDESLVKSTMCFHCFSDNMATTLASFGSLLAQHGRELLEYMITTASMLSTTGEGPVVVQGFEEGQSE